MKHLPSITAMLLVVSAGSARALEPANPQADAKARAILNYLEKLPKQPDKRLLSGQFTDAGPTAKLTVCKEIYDYTRFIDGVQKHFPKTTFFLAWNWKWSLGRNQNTKQLLEHPWLVNREDLPEALTTGRK